MINGCGFVFKHPDADICKFELLTKKNEIIYQHQQAYRINRLVGMQYVISTLHGVYRPHDLNAPFIAGDLLRFEVNTRE